MELSGGSPANNVGCCAESGGAQLPPPAGAALLVWLRLPVYLTVKHESLPANFPNFLWISMLKQMQINCLDVLNQSFMRFSRNDAENVIKKAGKISEVTVALRRNTRMKYWLQIKELEMLNYGCYTS